MLAREDDALHLALLALDRELAEVTRLEAMEALDRSIADDRVDRSLRSTLYASRMPACADLEGVYRLCKGRASCARAEVLFRALDEHQVIIGDVQDAWGACPAGLFGSTGTAAEGRSQGGRALSG